MVYLYLCERFVFSLGKINSYFNVVKHHFLYVSIFDKVVFITANQQTFVVLFLRFLHSRWSLLFKIAQRIFDLKFLYPKKKEMWPTSGLG